MINIFNRKSCAGRQLVRKPYISQDYAARREKISETKTSKKRRQINK